VSRNRLLILAAVLAVASATSLGFGITLQSKDIRSYIAAHYQAYSHDPDGTRYVCQGAPAAVVDTLVGYQSPEAQASNAGTQYLRYDNAMVMVGPDGTRPCSIRVEDLAAGYSHGAFVFLGPGFYPGAPASGAGGSPGGPGGTK
jgi:surface antigen